MMTIIEAPPKTGKTNWVLEQLLRVVDEGKYSRIFTNIYDLTVCGVRPLPDDADWRQVNPDRSYDKPQLLIIDEAQNFEAFKKENRSKDNDIGKQLSEHGHFGLDIWFLTQSSKDYLNSFVTGNCGRHIYIHRVRNKKGVKVYEWSQYQSTISNATMEKAHDVRHWYLNDHMHKYYKSSSVQTPDNDVRSSSKTNGVYISAAIIVIIAVFLIWNGIGFFTAKSQAERVQDVVKTQPETSQVSEVKTSEVFQAEQPKDPVQLEAQRVAMVFGSDSSCIAKNSAGRVIDMSFDECKKYSDDPRLLGSSYLPTTTTYDNFGVQEQPEPPVS